MGALAHDKFKNTSRPAGLVRTLVGTNRSGSPTSELLLASDESDNQAEPRFLLENSNIFPYAGKADVIFDSTLHYELPVDRSIASCR